MTFKVNFNGYEASVLGKEKYKDILQRHNIFTKKHTIGRVKACKEEINDAVQDVLSNKKGGKK